MRRILFVDDEPRVIKGLERSLYDMRGEWDMVFTDRGAKALALMEEQPFDVVVSDMRMPEMNGAELLNQVMRRHPRTVRLILSGHADSDLVLKCVGSTHQYLSKPCDPELLKATVDRATALEQTLQSQTLRQLVSQMERLPTLPSLYVEIVERVKSPEVPLEDIAAIVERDIGMTAKFLKLVNSAFFGLARPISDPREAVSYLGLDMIKSLVLSLHTFSEFDAPPVPGFSIEGLWRHSMQVAKAARAIARTQHAGSQLLGQAFTAGLLHDTGKLVLAGNFPAQYASVVSFTKTESLPWSVAERQMFGATHAEVGGYLLGLWGLPVPVVEAIALHHQPSLGPDRRFSPLLAVHVGNALARVLLDGPAEPGLTGLDLPYLTACGVAHQVEPWRATVREALQGSDDA